MILILMFISVAGVGVLCNKILIYSCFLMQRARGVRFRVSGEHPLV